MMQDDPGLSSGGPSAGAGRPGRMDAERRERKKAAEDSYAVVARLAVAASRRLAAGLRESSSGVPGLRVRRHSVLKQFEWTLDAHARVFRRVEVDLRGGDSRPSAALSQTVQPIRRPVLRLRRAHCGRQALTPVPGGPLPCSVLLATGPSRFYRTGLHPRKPFSVFPASRHPWKQPFPASVSSPSCNTIATPSAGFRSGRAASTTASTPSAL